MDDTRQPTLTLYDKGCRSDARVTELVEQLRQEGYTIDDIAYSLGYASGVTGSHRRTQYHLGQALGAVVLDEKVRELKERQR